MILNYRQLFIDYLEAINQDSRENIEYNENMIDYYDEDSDHDMRLVLVDLLEEELEVARHKMVKLVEALTELRTEAERKAILDEAIAQWKIKGIDHEED